MNILKLDCLDWDWIFVLHFPSQCREGFETTFGRYCEQGDGICTPKKMEPCGRTCRQNSHFRVHTVRHVRDVSVTIGGPYKHLRLIRSAHDMSEVCVLATVPLCESTQPPRVWALLGVDVYQAPCISGGFMRSGTVCAFLRHDTVAVKLNIIINLKYMNSEHFFKLSWNG